jgi:peroxiredoxin
MVQVILMRSACVIALSLSVGLWFVTAQDTKPDSARVARLAAIKKRFADENKELTASFQRAEDPSDKRAIQGEMRELALLTASKILDFIGDAPKDDTSLEAATFMLQIAGANGAGNADVEKVIALLAQYHAESPKIKDLLLPAMQLGESGEKLLKAVAEKNKDTDTKAVAMLARGQSIARQVAAEEDDAKAALMAKTAMDLLEQAVKESPKAKVSAAANSQTIEDIAKKEITTLKAVTSLAVGKPAPDVESLTIDGKKVKLSDYKGKVILLDIWATWCGPCRAMIPHERDLVKSMKDKPFELISVSADNKRETLVEFIAKEPMPWTHWWDEGPKSAVLQAYRVRAFPTLYVIDHTGVIRHKWVGSPGNDKIDAAIQELVKAAVKAKG